MLPDDLKEDLDSLETGLNAPDGAGCFPTLDSSPRSDFSPNVSMHLMVLGASRPRYTDKETLVHGSVSMHLMVLGASRLIGSDADTLCVEWSQCT